MFFNMIIVLIWKHLLLTNSASKLSSDNTRSLCGHFDTIMIMTRLLDRHLSMTSTDLLLIFDIKLNQHHHHKQQLQANSNPKCCLIIESDWFIELVNVHWPYIFYSALWLAADYNPERHLTTSYVPTNVNTVW